MKLTVIKAFSDGGEFGAKVEGVDLANLKPGELDAIRSAYLKFALLHIPDQEHLHPKQEAAFYRAVVPCVDESIQQKASRVGIPVRPSPKHFQCQIDGELCRR